MTVKIPEYKFLLNPEATPFRPSPLSPNPLKTQEEASFAQTIASSLTLSRLPGPEPTIFAGDPLKYTDWKISFMALIGKKPLLTSEKMFYLKNSLAGEACKAVEGLFYRNSEDAF